MMQWLLKRLKSRTHWFNTAIGTAVVIASTPEVLAVLPPDTVRWLALFAVAGNWYLREITTKPVREK